RTLSWTSDPFGTSSVRLGPSVITPAVPLDLSACQLLSASDLAPVLGPNPSSSSYSSGQCTYTSTTYPGRMLTLSLTTGLTHAQMNSHELTLNNSGNWCELGNWWPTGDNFYDLHASADDP